MRIYIVMKERQSAIAITSPKLHAAYKTRKLANQVASDMNKKAVTHQYWVESVKLEAAND